MEVCINGQSTSLASVLIVEDDADTAEVVSLLLQSQGFNVSTANCLQQAKAIGQTKQFDVVVSDKSLPDGDGASILEYFSREFGTRGVMISGMSPPDELPACVTQYLQKPVMPDDLFLALRHATG